MSLLRETTGGDDPLTMSHFYDVDSLQDRLIQRSLDIRGPDPVPPTEIFLQVQAYGQKYEEKIDQRKVQKKDEVDGGKQNGKK